jgi:hypothetical protein
MLSPAQEPERRRTSIRERHRYRPSRPSQDTRNHLSPRNVPRCRSDRSHVFRTLGNRYLGIQAFAPDRICLGDCQGFRCGRGDGEGAVVLLRLCQGCVGLGYEDAQLDAYRSYVRSSGNNAYM